MPSSGALYWFAPVYNHAKAGAITIRTTDIPNCGTTPAIYVGLWSPQTGNQFTQSLSFNNNASTGTFVNAASGSTNIAPVGFSMDARRYGACTPKSSTDPVVRFEGSLTY